MGKSNVEKLARLLKGLVLAVFICNLIALFFVPCVDLLSPLGLFQQLADRILHLLQIRPFGEDDVYVPMLGLAFVAWAEIWKDWVHVAYSAFLLLCGGCTAMILNRANHILNTILKTSPFVRENARAMKQTAVCCWVISGAAVVRVVAEIVALRNVAPLITYNAVAIPIFFMAGLLFLVMSALFGQAAELKEDQDLTI